MEALIVKLWPVLGTMLAALTAVGSAEILLLTLAGALRPRRLRPAGGAPRRMAVVVPAHDESAHIGRTVASLQAAVAARPDAAIVVIADNCTDDTAGRATVAGARVLVRDDPDRRGKGYALEHAFGILLGEGYEVLVVIDADTIVDKGVLREVDAAFQAGAAAVQVRYLPIPGDTMRDRLVGVALAAFNVVRPRGRERLALSVGLGGNGFALSAATLRAVPYDAHSIVEDLEYHLRLVRSGRRVRFLDHVAVYGEMPGRGAGAAEQRARWEGGRLGVARAQLPQLLANVARGRWRLIEPACELLTPPLAQYVLLLLATAAVPYAPARWYAAGALGVVSLHVLVAIMVAGRGWRDLGAVLAVPMYLLWKLARLPGIARNSRRSAAWVRTEREAP